MGQDQTEHRPPRRSFAPAFVAVLLGFAAIAPALAAAPDRAGLALGLQRVGACHIYGSTLELGAVSDATPTVACRGPHQSETVAISPLPAAVAVQHRRPSIARLREAVSTLPCGFAEVAAYVGSDPVNPHWFLSTEVRVATAAEWRAGERRYRCDVLVEGRASPGHLAPVRTGTLRLLMHRPESATIRPCLLEGSLVPCSRKHDTELFGSEIPPDAAGAADSRPLYETVICPRLAKTFLGREPRRAEVEVVLVEAMPARRWCALVVPQGRRPRAGTLAAQATGTTA